MAPNSQESNKYAALSQRCIGQAENYVRRHHNTQASQKGWDATAQALKAIAAQRGWNHHTPELIIDIAQQTADEQGRPDLVSMFGVTQALQTNIYENWLSGDVIEIYLNEVKTLLPELERIRAELPPPAFTPETDAQRHRWQRLTRRG